MVDFFANGHPGYYLLLLLFLACLALLLIGRRRRTTGGRADRLQVKYAEMTSPLLNETPDGELVDAVIANLMAKLKENHPDPLITLPQQSRGRCAVYFTWLLCKEIENGGPAALCKKPASRFTDIGIESMKIVGAAQTAEALRAYLTPEETAPDAETDPATEEKTAALLAAIEAEQPLSLCLSYIRSSPEEFLDTPPDDPAE